MKIKALMAAAAACLPLLAGGAAQNWERVFFEDFEGGISPEFKAAAQYPEKSAEIAGGKEALSGGKSLKIGGARVLRLLCGKVRGGFYYKIAFKYRVLKIPEHTSASAACMQSAGGKMGEKIFARKFAASAGSGTAELCGRVPAGCDAAEMAIFFSPKTSIVIDDIEISRTPAPAASEWILEKNLFSGMKFPPTDCGFLRPDSPENLMSKEQFFPFIDKYGQYKHRNWPNKIASDADFKARIEQEREFAASLKKRAARDKFGGYIFDGAPKLEATGRFRTQKINGKWWFVTPEGNLFWALGVNAVAMGSETAITGREHYFEDVKTRFYFVRPPAKYTYIKKGGIKCVMFTDRNLRVKYGKNFREDYCEVVFRRMEQWGINTIGPWTAERFLERDRYPHTYLLRSQGAPDFGGDGGAKKAGLSEYWRPMRDFFSPEFEKQTRAHFAKAAKYLGSPYCIGAFSDNENSWQSAVLKTARRALLTPKDQPAKIVFRNLLEKKYGNIGALNKAWGASYADFDGFLETSDFLPKTKESEADLLAFERMYYERYFSVCRAAIKDASPGALYLGCRFAWFNPLLVEVASRYCDVLSYNLYRENIDNFALPKGAVDKPILVGEFHFCNQDWGICGRSISVPSITMEKRVADFERYLKGAFANPAVAGALYFRWFDQMACGRSYDGENYATGLVDICDTPVYPMVKKMRELSDLMPRARLEASAKRK